MNTDFQIIKTNTKMENRKNNEKVIDVAVMIGLPGSGKSTFAENLAKGNSSFNGGVLISRDIIRFAKPIRIKGTSRLQSI